MLLAVAAWTGCDEQSSPSASTTPTTTITGSDSAAAYAALSSAQEQSDDTYDACSANAGTNMSAQAVCDKQRDDRNSALASMEDDAQNKLASETHHCRAVCDEDAGDDDAGSDDMNECIGHHAPKLPHCLGGLFSCLVDAGVFTRSASGREIRDCVRETNSCIVDELRQLRELRRHHHGSGSAGATAGAGGSTAGSGGAAAPSGGTGGTGGTAASGGSGGTSMNALPGDDDDKNDESDEHDQGKGKGHRWFGFGAWWHF